MLFLHFLHFLNFTRTLHYRLHPLPMAGIVPPGMVAPSMVVPPMVVPQMVAPPMVVPQMVAPPMVGMVGLPMAVPTVTPTAGVATSPMYPVVHYPHQLQLPMYRPHCCHPYGSYNRRKKFKVIETHDIFIFYADVQKPSYSHHHDTTYYHNYYWCWI